MVLNICRVLNHFQYRKYLLAYAFNKFERETLFSGFAKIYITAKYAACGLIRHCFRINADLSPLHMDPIGQ